MSSFQRCNNCIWGKKMCPYVHAENTPQKYMRLWYHMQLMCLVSNCSSSCFGSCNAYPAIICPVGFVYHACHAYSNTLLWKTLWIIKYYRAHHYLLLHAFLYPAMQYGNCIRSYFNESRAYTRHCKSYQRCFCLFPATLAPGEVETCLHRVRVSHDYSSVAQKQCS